MTDDRTPHPCDHEGTTGYACENLAAAPWRFCLVHLYGVAQPKREGTPADGA